MRLHIRLNPKKEDNRLITRWLARYHTGTQRQGIIKACLAAEARAFFAEAATRHHAPPAPVLPTPVVIPSFTNLGQLIQAQPSRATAREQDEKDRTP
jgi:hypothetical protein